ncbi:MAG: restriction endonuclease subunit S [Alphaproteobacteria bacterium]|nr:restriction endonuclease subunit S [Alphaproteobacteria bacterium]
MTDNAKSPILSKNVSSSIGLEPPLRFPGFEGVIKHVKFDKLVKLYRGSSPRPIIKFITNDPTGVNWIKIGDMPQSGNIVRAVSEKITSEGAKKSRKVVVGDIILSNSMSFGKPYIMGISGYIHDGWFVIREYEKNLYKDYLCQLLSSDYVQKQYRRMAAGGVVLNISSDLVNSVVVPVPVLDEQKKIADFLSLVDELIEKQRQLVEVLKRYKRGLLAHIFNNIQSENILSLGSVCNITTGKLDANAMIPNGKYRFYTCAKEYYQIDKYAFDTDALLISGNGANVGYIHHYKGKFNAYQRTYVLDSFHEEIMYVYYYLQAYLHPHIESEKKAGNTPYIVLSTLTEMEIPFPSKDVQTRIAQALSIIDLRINCEQTILDNLDKQKSGLLQQMFI